jgi:hypothetical protein
MVHHVGLLQGLLCLLGGRGGALCLAGLVLDRLRGLLHGLLRLLVRQRRKRHRKLRGLTQP